MHFFVAILFCSYKPVGKNVITKTLQIRELFFSTLVDSRQRWSYSDKRQFKCASALIFPNPFFQVKPKKDDSGHLFFDRNYIGSAGPAGIAPGIIAIRARSITSSWWLRGGQVGRVERNNIVPRWSIAALSGTYRARTVFFQVHRPRRFLRFLSNFRIPIFTCKTFSETFSHRQELSVFPGR